MSRWMFDPPTQRLDPVFFSGEGPSVGQSGATAELPRPFPHDFTPTTGTGSRDEDRGAASDDSL